MCIKIWQDNGHYAKSISSSVECLKSDKMQVGFYTLKAKEGINIVPDDYSVTTTLIILSGELKLFSSKESYELRAHDMVMLTDIKLSFCAEAVTHVKLIAITSEANQDSEEDETLASMLKEVEAKDVYTLGHSKRVSLYSKRIALAYESTYNVASLGSAASMHDIGKINTPIEILQKAGKLTKEEFDIIKRHPSDSYDILKDKIGERVAIAAKQHHERLDGTGYPDGLYEKDICIDARIIAVADVFDAMTCKRIYNEPTLPIKVVEMLEANSHQYDPVIVGILRRKVENGEMDDVLTAFHPESI